MTHPSPEEREPAPKPGASESRLSKARERLLLFLIGILLMLTVYLAPPRPEAPLVRRGRIDAAAAAGQNRLFTDIAALAGEWELVESSWLKSGGRGPAYAQLPGKWPEPRGWAVYRLRVSGLDPGRRYALRVPFVDTSCRLSADGKELLAAGVPGRTKESSKPSYRAAIARLPPGISSTELVLEASNFVNTSGGMRQAIILGSEGSIASYDSWSRWPTGFNIFFIFLMGGIFMLNALLRRMPSSAWFGAICAMGGICVFLVSPDVPVYGLFPDLDWGLYARVSYICCYSVPLLFLVMAWSLYGGVPRAFVAAAALPFALLSAFVAIAPPETFTSANPLIEIYALFLIISSIAIFARAVKKGYPYAKLISLGILNEFLIMLSVLLAANSGTNQGAFYSFSFLYGLVGDSWAARFAVSTASYAISMLSILAFSVLLFVDASRRGRAKALMAAGPEKADSAETEKIRVKCLSLGLSSREAEVVMLALAGKRNKEIGEELFISLNTVKTHLARIFKKVGIRSRSELFAYFAEP
jgi:two-component system, sensor histidine kinase ChiS